MTNREQELLSKYNDYKEKRQICFQQKNHPKYLIYKYKMDAIRTTLGILGINIDGINR
ncbi:hypothetical protein [Paenibacillus sp. O199]|uniref:hypothetical protein n=1 Tax=Paenibacillus sp. O199 TaxID=1643925 RepID=UPI000A53AE32|nr:hypothetical protein [Paenibacillus sp. O199]